MEFARNGVLRQLLMQEQKVTQSSQKLAHGSCEALRATLLALVLLLPICLSTPNALLLLVCTMAACMALAVGFARFLTRKLGGITGDTIGATIELAEIATFFIFYLFWKLA